MPSVFRASVMLASVFCLLLASPAAAQQSREEELARAQAEKAKQLHEYEPNAAEKILARAVRYLSGPPRTFYPWFGSVYSGGWMAVGVGYRHPFSRGNVFNSQVAISLKAYTLARATYDTPEFANRMLRASFLAESIDAKEVAFYGIGNDTAKDAEQDFRYRPNTLGARLSFVPTRFVDVGGGVNYLDIATDQSADPAYVVTKAHAVFDWREAPGYTRSGGAYRVEWSEYNERTRTGFDFSRVDADVSQFVPILRGQWVLAFRALASMAYTDADNQVPFFLMPSLGGGSDLRGFPSWRFRDRNKMLLTAEYRWTPSHFVDMAIFHDAGKVTARKEEFNFRGLHHTNGIGIRFHTPGATILRIEVAHGSEGTSLIFAFSPVG